MISKFCLYFHRLQYFKPNKVHESNKIQTRLSSREENIRRNPHLLGCHRFIHLLPEHSQASHRDPERDETSKQNPIQEGTRNSGFKILTNAIQLNYSMEKKEEGFYSQTNSATSIATTISEEIIPTQRLASTLKTLEIPKQPEHKRSVHFLTTSTSTTTLPPEKIIRLRPELNTLLSVLIKQNRSAIKSQHHIEILNQAIESRTPPRGLRPRVNPRIPDNKNIDFLIEWDQVTTDAALSYTRLLLKHWEHVLLTSTENISNIEARIEAQGTTTEEWNYIKDAIDKVRSQTQEDLDRKQDRPNRPQMINQRQQQPQMNSPSPSTSFFQQQAPLPQRQRRDREGSRREPQL